jgi:hypothetical protein
VFALRLFGAGTWLDYPIRGKVELRKPVQLALDDRFDAVNPSALINRINVTASERSGFVTLRKSGSGIRMVPVESHDQLSCVEQQYDPREPTGHASKQLHLLAARCCS